MSGTNMFFLLTTDHQCGAARELHYSQHRRAPLVSTPTSSSSSPIVVGRLNHSIVRRRRDDRGAQGSMVYRERLRSSIELKPRYYQHQLASSLCTADS
ncbi:hypothetical protein E2562_020762 [Oryza meyeriana var. granulata]|uniref:Uncharacterized protein n=1 Tax=Oryza meyeriana var. granulata TaxID=110450 RepID=A0A6G1CHF3_9ORYZ|nr:hypothetical protein E2562_020762 [Oryza meyeriana var. granulata]